MPLDFLKWNKSGFWRNKNVYSLTDVKRFEKLRVLEICELQTGHVNNWFLEITRNMICYAVTRTFEKKQNSFNNFLQIYDLDFDYSRTCSNGYLYSEKTCINQP